MKEIKYTSRNSDGIIKIEKLEPVVTNQNAENRFRIFGTFVGTETNRLFSAVSKSEVTHKIYPFIVKQSELDRGLIVDYTCG